jgi:hypothetical protein
MKNSFSKIFKNSTAALLKTSSYSHINGKNFKFIKITIPTKDERILFFLARRDMVHIQAYKKEFDKTIFFISFPSFSVIQKWSDNAKFFKLKEFMSKDEFSRALRSGKTGIYWTYGGFKVNWDLAKQKKFSTKPFTILLKVAMKFIFFKELRLKGVGFRSLGFLNYIYFKIGFTHYVGIKLPKNVSTFSKKDKIVVYGSEEQVLSLFCQKIKNFRIPDVYKSKGILFSSQTLVLKPGKQR